MVAGIVEITLNEFVFDNIARRASTTLQKKTLPQIFFKTFPGEFLNYGW